jgi:hypothetical protein
MLKFSQPYWAHPVLVPVLMLDMLVFTLENQVQLNIRDVERIEKTVADLPRLDMDKRPGANRADITQLVTELQNILKGAIKLLDAAHWASKTAAMLLDFGEQLDKISPDGTPGIKREWADIKEFLQDLQRLTAYLEPDPVMTQQRCQSQINIVSG